MEPESCVGLMEPAGELAALQKADEGVDKKHKGCGQGGVCVHVGGVKDDCMLGHSVAEIV